MLILDQMDFYRNSFNTVSISLPSEVHHSLETQVSPSIVRRQFTTGFSSLPGELLCTVFCLILDDLDYDKTKNAIILSGINKKCRETVTSTPSFWDTLISDLGPGLARISLQRSFHGFLSLHIGARISRLEAFLLLIKNDYERFSSVKFHNYRGWKTFTYFFKDFSFISLSKLNIREGVLEDEFVPNVLAVFQMPNLTCYEGPWFTKNRKVTWMNNLIQVSFLIASNSDRVTYFFDVLHKLTACQRLELHFGHRKRCTHRVAGLPGTKSWDRDADQYSRDHTKPDTWRFWTRGVETDAGDAGSDPDEDGGQNITELDDRRRKSILPRLRHLLIDVECQEEFSMFKSRLENGAVPLGQITHLRFTIRDNTLHSTSGFQDIFHSSSLESLTWFEVNYTEKGGDCIPISLRTMLVLEHLSIEDCINPNTIERYMDDAKTLTTLKTITLRNCKIHEGSLIELAQVLVERTRLHPFELLRLYNSALSPSTLSSLCSIMPLQKIEFVLPIL